MAIGSQRMAYREMAEGQEPGHLRGELSREQLSQVALALAPVPWGLESAVLDPSCSPQDSSV